jgi:hypothetical protein
MTEAVLTANPRPSVWTLIGEDLDSVFDRDPAARTRFEVYLIPDPVAGAITCLLDRIRLLEQEVGVHGCRLGGTEPKDERGNCDAQQVCEPPEPAAVGVVGQQRGAGA